VTRWRKPLWDLYFFPLPPVSNLDAVRPHIACGIQAPDRGQPGAPGLFVHSALSIAGREKFRAQKEQRSMMDILMIGIGVLFFALSLAYTTACDRL